MATFTSGSIKPSATNGNPKDNDFLNLFNFSFTKCETYCDYHW